MDNPDRQETFVRLLTRHERELRRYALALLADPGAVDDVLQETSVALWRKCSEYNDAEPFVPWACRFVYYEVLKYRRQQRMQKRFFSEATVELLASECVPLDDAFDRERSALQDCLTQLPVADRELIGLRYATNVSIANLASETGQPAKGLYRALERIRHLLVACVQRKLALEGGQ